MRTSTKRAQLGAFGAAVLALALMAPVMPAFAEDNPPPTEESVSSTEVAAPPTETTPSEESAPVEEPAPEPPAEPIAEEQPVPEPASEPVEQQVAQEIVTQRVAPVTTSGDRQLICTDITTGLGYESKVDTPGDPATVPYTAPAGFLVDAYCVKAGTEPIIVPVNPPSATVVIDHPNKDSVSHYQVHLVPVPTEPKKEVAIYYYPLLDPSKPPAWENSGLQTFCESKTGADWFTSVNCELPEEVCGPNWGAQQDKVQGWTYAGPFQWPTNIQYPNDNIGWPPIYDAKHQLLSDLINVPDCAPPKEETTLVQPKGEPGPAVCVDGVSTGTDGSITFYWSEGAYFVEVPETADLEEGETHVETNVPPGVYFFTGAAKDGYELVLNEIDGVKTNLWEVKVEESTPVDCEEEPLMTNPDYPDKVCPADPEDPPFDFPGVEDGPINGTDNVYDSGYYLTVVDDQRDAGGAGVIEFTFQPEEGVVFDPLINELDENGYAHFTLVYDGTECDEEPEVVVPTTPQPTCEMQPLPTSEDGVYTVTVTNVNGDRKVTYTFTPNEGVEVANIAGSDYKVDENGNAVWEFIFENCPTPTPDPTPVPKPSSSLPNTGFELPILPIGIAAALLVLGAFLVNARRRQMEQQGS